MKVKLIICFVLVLCPARQGPARDEPGQPVAISIIWDASASLRPNWPDVYSLCTQTVSSLQSGDYIEIVSAHAGKPQLRIAQFIKQDDPAQMANIRATLDKIKCPLIMDAHVEKALQIASRRLEKFCRSHEAHRPVLLVFTNGQLIDAEVRQMRESGRMFKKRGWKFYVTSSSQTNRAVLISSCQGLLEWSLIRDANPVLWIENTRSAGTEEDADKQTPVAPDVPPVTADASPRSGLDTEPAVPFTEGPEEPAETPPVVVPDDLPQETEEPEKPPASTAEAEPPAEGPQELPAPTAEGETPVEEQAPSEPAIPEELAKKRLKRWLFLSVIAIGLVLAAAIIHGLSKALRWKSRHTPAEAKQKQPGTLIASINGHVHTLGRIDRIGAVNIGKDENNTIRINDASISGRHARIYSKGRNLMLRNIGKTPIMVNGSAVKPNARQILIIPSVIEFNGRNRLNLSIARPKAVPQNIKEKNHGTE